MRWLFYILLLANLALFAATRYLHLGAPSVQSAPTRVGGSKLTMLSEVPADKLQLRGPDKPQAPPPPQTQTPAPVQSAEAAPSMGQKADDKGPQGSTAAATGAEDNAAVKPPEKPALCYKIKGLESKVALANLTGLLEEAGANVYAHGDAKGQRTSYWVMLPPASSRAKAERSIARLKAKGIKDYYLVRDGDHVNAVSLGVFRGEQSAKRRYHQIRRLGFGAKLEQIQLPVSHYWLAFRWTGAADAPSLKRISEKSGGSGLTPVSCP